MIKKTYIRPGIESERLDLPEALAEDASCDIHLAATSQWYYGDAYGYQVPTFDC